MTTGLQSRGLRPASELAKTRPHGDRMRYIGGCRCDDCRRANTAYETARARARKAGEWNGLVPADKARAHILELSKQGIGRDQVADASGMASSTLNLIARGQRKRLRAMNEKALLAVTPEAIADGAHIDAGPTWALLDDLIATGYTKARLAHELGCVMPALQISRNQCKASTALKVERLHKRLRRVPAGDSLALIAELREEGYRPDRIETMLQQLAQRLYQDAPDLDTTTGFIHAGTAELLQQLHQEITEVPA
jgi:hypothetical protein